MNKSTQPTVLRRAAIDIALTFARQFLAGLLQLGLAVAISRLLGPQGAGSYALALLYPTILAQMNFGLSSACVYFVASRRFSAQQAWATSRDFLVVEAIVVSALMALIVVKFGATIIPGVAIQVLLIALFVYPLNLIANLIYSLLQAQQDFRSFNLATLVQPVVAVLGLLCVWLLGAFDLERVMYIILLSHAAALGSALLLLSRSIAVFEPAREYAAFLRPAVGYGLKAHLSNLLSLATYRLDLLLLNYYVGTAAAGLYAVAVRLAEQLLIVSEAFSIVLYPRLSAIDTAEDRNALTPIMSRAVLWLTMAAAAVLALIAQPLIALLFGQEFIGSTIAMLLLLPGIVFFSCARVLAHDLASQGRVGINLALSVVALVVSTIANVLLLPQYGIVGASIAASFTYLLVLFAHLAIQRHYNGFAAPLLMVATREDLRRLQSALMRSAR